jgi:Na+/phosphate symporter
MAADEMDGDELSVDMAAGDEGDEDEMMVVAEVRRLVREQLETLGLKTNKKPVAVNEVAELTKQLNETRVLTARSLFLNKILVSEASLTEAQRRKIVEYLDAGNTVNEVKDIYGKIVKAINKNKAKRKEGTASSLNESANVNGKQIREVSDLMNVPMFDANRWSKLAGIGKGR